MDVGDMIVKIKGTSSGSVGIITRVYNKNHVAQSKQTHVIYQVLSEGKIHQWAGSWCAPAQDEFNLVLRQCRGGNND